MLLERAGLPSPRCSLSLVICVIRAHHTATGSRWRRLEPAHQALLLLIRLRKGPLRPPRSGVRSGRLHRVAVRGRLLAAQAPTLERGYTAPEDADMDT